MAPKTVDAEIIELKKMYKNKKRNEKEGKGKRDYKYYQESFKKNQKKSIN